MLPRPIYEGDIYLVTRGTHNRRICLRPVDEPTQKKIEYLVAVFAERHGILIHALCFLGTHYHLVATDPGARIPFFYRDLHAFIARVLNADILRIDASWDGCFWERKQTNLVRPQQDNDVLEEIVYTLTNPVRHRLVEDAGKWPGLRTAWPATRDPVPRPDYFSADGSMPETATLVLSRPPIYLPDEHADPEAQRQAQRQADIDLIDLIAQRTAETQAELVAEARRDHKPFLGLPAITAQTHRDAALTQHPKGTRIPKIRAEDRAVYIAAINRYNAWLDAYKTEHTEYRAGNPALFPHGTFQLRLFHNVPVLPKPEDP